MKLIFRLLVLHCFVLVVVCTSGCRQAADLGPGVTLNGILSLRPGMTYAELVAAIGEPLQMEVETRAHREGDVTLLGHLVPTRQPNDGHVVLTYTRPMNLLTTYPMLWVHMQSGRVASISAKRYFALGPFGGDDEGIYGYSVGGKRWSNPDVLAEMLRP